MIVIAAIVWFVTFYILPLGDCALVCQHRENYKFNAAFSFGVATSAYQVEGAWNVSGKGISLWDTISHETSLIKDGSTGDVACNSYNKIDQDVDMLKSLGVNHYRFSIAWTRILPTGRKDNVNLEGLAYYDKLINKLLKNGIKPWVTIYHYDHPMVLGNWGQSNIANNIADYADILFNKFGDRVKTWITINQPNVICTNAVKKFGLRSGIDEYVCSTNILKAHAAIWDVYNKKYRATQQGKLSMALNLQGNLPATYKKEDIEAVERVNQFEFGLFVHPLVYGNYPQTVIDIIAKYSQQQGYNTSRLPVLSAEHLAALKGSYDFIGLNNYDATLVTSNNGIINQTPSYINDYGANVVMPAWTTSDKIKMSAKGLGAALNWIKNTYNNPEIRITEQGWAETKDDLIDDNRRKYMLANLARILRCIYEDKINITGYTVWSLMDTFEWFDGYKIKYGLHCVDFKTSLGTRLPKTSSITYSLLTRRRSLSGL